MISKGKRKNLVKRYPHPLDAAIASLVNDIAVDWQVPVHMLYGVSRQRFKQEYPQHQQIPRS